MKVIVPALMKINEASRQIRLWSAACSTGDEAYTLAILLRSYPPLANWTIDILASDISQRPRSGTKGRVLGSHSLGKCRRGSLAKYFSGLRKSNASRHYVQERRQVHECQLYDRPRLKLIQGIDVIFVETVSSILMTKPRPRSSLICGMPFGRRASSHRVSEALPDKGGAFRPFIPAVQSVYEKQ
ncbi:MAG: CheR family methyltransferase [Nitrospiraceae bacterium]